MNIIGIILFGATAIGSAVAAITGATHQWGVCVLSLIMIIAFAVEYRAEKEDEYKYR